jgi:acyl-CoA reductase-like NAD-dependent aldehyde dehydrogenase
MTYEVTTPVTETVVRTIALATEQDTDAEITRAGKPSAFGET